MRISDWSSDVCSSDLTQRSVMFLDELHDLKDRHLERFRILHVLSREQQESELLTGRLDAARFGAILDSLIEVATVDDWFLCGPQEMVAELSRVLAERGADQVRSEEHTSELQSLMRISYAVFCLKK